MFEKANFRKEVSFDLAEFTLGVFRGAKFAGDISFFAIACRRGFLLEETTFERVPNFVQAKFSEAPDVTRETITSKQIDFQGEPDDLRKRCAALKRLATQAQDHRAELEFFADELRAAQRTSVRALFKVAGVWYARLSDYGRSMARPVVWWLACGLVFWCVYMLVAAAGIRGSDPWSKASVIKAANLALTGNILNAGPFTESERTAMLQHISGTGVFYRALYLVGVLHRMLAALLLFLFLLALRNHFRIR